MAKAADNHRQIGHSAELPQSLALLAVVRQFHADALIERDEQMLTDTEDKQPDQHHGKAGRSETDQQYAESA